MISLGVASGRRLVWSIMLATVCQVSFEGSLATGEFRLDTGTKSYYATGCILHTEDRRRECLLPDVFRLRR
jgi:hypothetical protein